MQMTTDTAARVTRMVVQQKSKSSSSQWNSIISDLSIPVPLDKIPFTDHPELVINKHESTQMPFRYVKGKDGQPVMPEVWLSAYCFLNANEIRA